jgi:hypothetical protein
MPVGRSRRVGARETGFRMCKASVGWGADKPASTVASLRPCSINCRLRGRQRGGRRDAKAAARDEVRAARSSEAQFGRRAPPLVDAMASSPGGSPCSRTRNVAEAPVRRVGPCRRMRRRGAGRLGGASRRHCDNPARTGASTSGIVPFAAAARLRLGEGDRATPIALATPLVAERFLPARPRVYHSPLPGRRSPARPADG